MINKFESNKKYMFDKEIALQDEHLKANYESGNATQGKDYNEICEKIKEYLEKDEESFKEELCDFMIRGMFAEEY